MFLPVLVLKTNSNFFTAGHKIALSHQVTSLDERLICTTAALTLFNPKNLPLNVLNSSAD